MKRIVCDTGPLVHLYEANLLNLLEAAGKVLLPPGGANELEGVAPELKLGDLPWLVTRPLHQPHDAEARDWHRAGLLHLGEAEALALARQERADWFLTDDSAAGPHKTTKPGIPIFGGHSLCNHADGMKPGLD